MSTEPSDATTTTPDDESHGGLTVSSAGSSFSDTETSLGGADAGPSTPDVAPQENKDENSDLTD